MDWLVRRLVERKLGLKLLARLPLPRDAVLGATIAKNAARLSTVDERWRLLADGTGVEVGPLSVEEMTELRAEIDALVARSYGLSFDELKVVFANFGEVAVPEAYRERVQHYYDSVAVAA
jgi:hypothetical protein